MPVSGAAFRLVQVDQEDGCKGLGFRLVIGDPVIALPMQEEPFWVL